MFQQRTTTARTTLGTLGRTSRRLSITMVLGFLMLGGASPGVAVCGDCDANGVVDVADVLAVVQHVSGATTIKGPRLMDCDVNRDGPVNVLDVLLLTQVTGGLRPASDLVCTTCGDCNGNGTAYDGTDVDVFPPSGTIVAATSGQAACDTNGDGILDFSELPTFVSQAHTCSTCGDCDLNGDVNFDDATRAASGVPMGLPFTSCTIQGVSPNAINVLDALQIARFDAGLLPTLMCEDPNVAQP